ncbi:hypothetical protein [Bradyrhizobium sp. CIR3A]|uniref:hypothetical protein n=1 Tax=Bradyrhizobium sp. CIR3A TaxID=2663838 RepID=UPI0016065725|nr:hypothetical protein [Bradyrhizobium sp. CIR3A]MBB4259929.1 hypothetical protein [Bradyrhizobium sp. CIR3A]
MCHVLARVAFNSLGDQSHAAFTQLQASNIGRLMRPVNKMEIHILQRGASAFPSARACATIPLFAFRQRADFVRAS